MKKILLFLLVIISISSYAQFKATGYFDGKIGLSYAFSEKFQSELRIDDALGKEFNSSFNFQYKIVSKENFNINLGIGVSLQPFHSSNDTYESVFFPVIVEITPFSSIKNIAFVLETAYHNSDINEDSGLRNSIGIRYIFHKNNGKRP